MTEYLLYLYAESPVHAGASDSLDVLDLPVQREAATSYPVIWGQSLKGALRQAASESGWTADEVTAVFGSSIERPDEDGGTSAGTLAVGDAQLVAMPVPTVRRTFAWASTAIMLARLARRYRTLDRPVPPCPQVPSDAARSASTAWTRGKDEVFGPCVVATQVDEPTRGWAELLARDALGSDAVFEPFARKLTDDLVVVGDDIAPTLLRECTEQTARVQLGASKKVEHGPFYSEYLPTETILASSLTLRGRGDTADHRELLRDLLDGSLLQVGGDETLGKGLMWARLLGAEG